ncbi:putative RNA 2'-phosphotransferase [Spirochaetia bacterium]|nr:putative RNA 2'-phosphotransferase [Spirochaetia bacterium]
MNNPVQLSKFLSLVLRHRPEIIHLNMDSAGWVDMDELITNAGKYNNIQLNKEIITEIVKTNDKQRFIVDAENSRIRANQGHSINIDLGLEPQTPPPELYHGTAARFIPSIMENGLRPMSRQYVHLSRTIETALTVVKRHGEPVVLSINAKAMYENGYTFYLSENNVWLADHVPREYMSYDRKA